MEIILIVLLCIVLVIIALFYLVAFVVLLSVRSDYKKVRTIHAKLYGDGKDYKDWLGDTINKCVLCPQCRGFIFVGSWEKHIKGNHYRVHSIKPIEEEFKKGMERLNA